MFSAHFLLFIFRSAFVPLGFQYTLAQPQSYYGSPSTAGQKYTYAQPSAGTAASYLSSLQASANQLLNAQATNNAIQYASPYQQFYQPSSLTAAKYGYAQVPGTQKLFYASS